MLMRYIAKNGKRVLFDDWCDDFKDNGMEDGGFWTTVCKSCKEKYKDELEGHTRPSGGRYCGICGCNNNETDDGYESYYVDLNRDEVSFYNSKSDLPLIDWITVEKRLPVTSEWLTQFIATVERDAGKGKYTWTSALDWENTTVKGKEVSRWRHNDRNIPESWKVVAWAALPPPYQRPEEEA